MIARSALIGAAIVDAAAVSAQVAGGTGGADVAITLLNYGVLGALVVLLLTGRLRRSAEVDEANGRTAAAEARAVAAETRERELERTMRESVVPAMVRFTDNAVTILGRLQK